MKATSLREAIVRIFEAEPNKRFALKEVYEKIEDHYDLSEHEQEFDARYPQPRFYHEARSIIASLEKEGIIERLDRDRRKLKAKT